MHVLHYNLGLPPYRSGGLTAWSMDLIEHQINQGVQVSLLFPGEIQLMSKKMKIEHSNSYKKAKVFRLVNPLPVPLIYGIDSAQHYLHYDKDANFTAFFVNNKIDVVHLHTLMGLPIEFLEQAKKNDIKLIYTTHDTFGVWPEPQLDTSDTNTDPIFYRGYIGNQRKLPYLTIVMMQSPVYRALKATKVVRLVKTIANEIRAVVHTGYSTEVINEHGLKNRRLYDQMRDRYKKYFDLIDLIHYNSSFTKDIFERYRITMPSVVLPVYHSYLPIRPAQPNSRNRLADDRKLRILYNGTREQYKGYNLLLEILDEFNNEGIDNFEVTIYGSGVSGRPYIKLVEAYDMSALENVYAGIDVTIVPSLCYETFGMVVAESLSFDVPVLLSKNVGAKSLMSGGNYGYEFQSRQNFKEYLGSILSNPKILADQKKAILASEELIFDSDAVYVDILNLYSKDVVV